MENLNSKKKDLAELYEILKRHCKTHGNLRCQAFSELLQREEFWEIIDEIFKK